jgi:succinate-acetate transporter protein
MTFGNFEFHLNPAMLNALMKIKEPFLLIFSLLWLAFCLLPAGFFRRRNGEPYDDLLFRRIAFAGIGIAMLVLWYSLPK